MFNSIENSKINIKICMYVYLLLGFTAWITLKNNNYTGTMSIYDRHVQISYEMQKKCYDTNLL